MSALSLSVELFLCSLLDTVYAIEKENCYKKNTQEHGHTHQYGPNRIDVASYAKGTTVVILNYVSCWFIDYCI